MGQSVFPTPSNSGVNYISNTFSSLPSASLANRGNTYFTSDTGVLYISTGARWIPWTSIDNSIPIDLLVIAGGASGGALNGGGAGGVLELTSRLVIPGTTYTCTVGSGGAGVNVGSTGTLPGIAGSNSQFGSFTAAVGGGRGAAGGDPANNAGNGGSGGGTARLITFQGLGTAGQGRDGGYSTNTGDARAGAGGGGAGAVGGNCTQTSFACGAGGAGTNVYSSWATATTTGVSGFYGGGGGGGADDVANTAPQPGGSGGGGTGGGGNTNGTVGNGTANTGSGGGGVGVRRASTNSGSGGSGLVIARFTGTYTAAATTGSPTRVVTGGFTYYTWTGNGSITI